ncbi:MAG: hypothetical protein Q8O95_05780 [bacterium]|nr:hypothetical protein [bacterium]
MNYVVRVIFVFLLVLLNLSEANASGDMLSPSSLVFDVNAGELFSFDLSFRSQSGGYYELISVPFLYDEEGRRLEKEDLLNVFSFETQELFFEPEQEQYLPVTVSVPDNLEEGDYYYLVSVRKRGDEGATVSYELGALVYLSYGEKGAPKGKLLETSLRMDEGSITDIQAVQFNFQNEATRFFVVIPELVVYDEEGNEIENFDGEASPVFPEFPKHLNLVNRSGKALRSEDFSSAELLIRTRQGDLLDRAPVVFLEETRLISKEKVLSPLQPYRERKRFQFLYSPIFQGFALFIGLTLVLISFFLGRKK